MQKESEDRFSGKSVNIWCFFGIIRQYLTVENFLSPPPLTPGQSIEEFLQSFFCFCWYCFSTSLVENIKQKLFIFRYWHDWSAFQSILCMGGQLATLLVVNIAKFSSIWQSNLVKLTWYSLIITHPSEPHIRIFSLSPFLEIVLMIF